MNEFHGSTLGEDATDVESARTLSEASDILAALLKALKAYRLYLPNHPLLQEFVGTFHARLHAYLEIEEELSFRVSQSRISVNDEPVYENQVKEESLAFRLFIHGVREIIFHVGVPPEELASFLQIIHRAFDTQQAAEELLANLWERELPHINFIVLDDLFDAEEGAEFDEYMRSQQATASPPEPRPGLPFVADSLPSVEPAKFSPEDRESLSDLLLLNDREQALLEARIEETDEQDVLGTLGDLLLTLLPECREIGLKDDLPSVLASAVEALLAAGSLEGAARIQRELRTFNVGTEDGCTARAIFAARAESIVTALEPHLAERPLRNPDLLAEFLADLGPDVVRLLARCLEEPRTREGSIEVLRRIAPRLPEPLLEIARCADGAYLRPLLRILGETGDERALEIAERHLGAREAKVRREALLCIQKLATDRSFQILLGQLSAGEPEMRILAARALESIPPGPHLAPLLDLARSRSFAKREFLEKREILRALGRQQDREAENYLVSLTRRPAWFRKKTDDDLRAAATAALGQSRSEGARAVLKKLAEDPSPQVRRAAAFALRDMHAEPEPPPTAPE